MEGFAPNNPEIYGAFGTILSLARELNISVQVPELVVVDCEGSQVAGLVSALLLHEFLPTDQKLNRPLHLHIVHNGAAETPKVTLRREGSGGASNKDEQLSDASVAAAAIRHRNTSTTEPLHVTVEFAKCWSINLILTPPMEQVTTAAAAEGDSSADIAAAVAGSPLEALARPTHRTLVFIERAADWDKCAGPALGRTLDPAGERSLFVYSQFNSHVQAFQGTRELNAYLTKAGPEGRFFFATLGAPSDLEKLHQADMDLLEQLQYDLRYERTVGAPLLRRHLIEQTWRRYQSFVPEIIKSLRLFKQKSDDDHRRISGQLLSMDSYKLRGVANTYVMDFLQSVEKLSVGTLEGNPALNGQTLDEEKAAPGGAGDWLDGETFRPLTAAKPVAGHDSKLYGGQQFERLLSEFHSLVEATSMSPASVAEIATAAGPLRLAQPSNLAWAASDVARKAASRIFVPLVRQLFERARYIMERQVTIVDQMLDAKRKAQRKGRGGAGASASIGASDHHAGGGGGIGLSSLGVSSSGVGDSSSSVPGVLSNIEDFPYFTNKVKEFYLDFVNDLAVRCQEKCQDEFACTQLVYWEQQVDESLLPSSKKAGDPEAVAAAVNALAQQQFDSIKKRIATNIMLKCHSFFLVPVTERLWGELQGKITCLTDQEMEQLFEVKVTLEKLKREEKQLANVSQKFVALEGEFSKASSIFSRRPI